jgi:dTDP-4-dehydrorhamnose reductase
MKFLLLGRNGQVGWELQRALAPLGEVIALSRMELDLCDPDALLRGLASVSPDIVVNAAAYTAVDRAEAEPDRADEINRVAVEALARWAVSADAGLVHYSTDYVFDGRKPIAYLETDQTAPQNAYGRSKRDGETAILASGCRHLILRTSWVHAARGSNFVRTMLRLARERSELKVVADQFGAPTGAELIADATAIAIAAFARREQPLAAGIYHLTASGETSWHDLARFVIAEAVEGGANLKATPDNIAPIASCLYPTAAKRPSNSLLDTGKLRAALGIKLPDWKAGVRRTVAELLEGGRP